MALIEKINDDLKAAMRDNDPLQLSVLRLLSAAIHNKEIEKRTRLSKEGKPPEPLTEEEVLAVVMSEAKKRREAIDSFEKGGRQELAEKERKELEILQGYLPEQLSREAVAKAVEEAIGSTGASGPKDVGKVMGYLSPKLKGKADMTRVSKLVADKLSGGT